MVCGLWFVDTVISTPYSSSGVGEAAGGPCCVATLRVQGQGLSVCVKLAGKWRRSGGYSVACGRSTDTASPLGGSGTGTSDRVRRSCQIPLQVQFPHSTTTTGTASHATPATTAIRTVTTLLALLHLQATITLLLLPLLYTAIFTEHCIVRGYSLRSPHSTLEQYCTAPLVGRLQAAGCTVYCYGGLLPELPSETNTADSTFGFHYPLPTLHHLPHPPRKSMPFTATTTTGTSNTHNP